MHYVRETLKICTGNLETEIRILCLLCTACYVLSGIKVQLTVELVKCTLLLNRLLVLQIYCCVVGVNNVATEQRL